MFWILFHHKLSNFQLIKFERRQGKFSICILRLLAGNSGPICTEFPMTTFSAKILNRHPLKKYKFPSKKLNSISCKNNWRVIAIFSFTLKKKQNSLESFFQRNYDSTWLYISQPFHASILCTRSLKSPVSNITQDVKERK